MTPAATLLRRVSVPLLLSALVAGGIAALVSARKDPGVDLALTLAVPSPTRQDDPEREKTGNTETSFETLQSAELFAETLVGWLSSPDVVAAVYRRAGVAFPRATVRRLSRAVTAVKRGGPVVDVHVRTRSANDAQALARALAAELEERTAAFTAAGGLTFRVTASDPLIIQAPVSPPLRGLVAGLIVFIFGLNAVLLVDFLRSSPESKT